MPGYAAFLRGINLGRHHRVTSAQLRSCFEELGLREVSTFRASGNVVFDAERPDGLGQSIEEGLAAALGYEVPVFLRTAAELRTIAAHRPFDRELVDSSEGTLQVSLLSARPSKKVRDQVLALATDQDRLAFGDRELYWLPSGGMRDSPLDLRAIEKLLGPDTRRTKGTVEELAAKHFAG